ncbi:uncharacterized protein [Neodiprion pinetum]|uniref:uncharacterized protein n=1 Tax=Neodiprion pinetum TaxID=441929 RepID=UPI00371A8644
MKAAIAVELHRQARRNYPRRFADVRGLDETWQADLVDMTAYSSRNKGYKYLLTIIDIFSKYAWAVPIKSKSGKDVTAAMKSVLTQSHHPIEGGFYEEELGKVKYPDGYLVENVLRKRGNRVYVKWLGFDSSHNSWINKTDM